MMNVGKPVAVYTLGRFAVVKGGQPLRFATKTPRKPLELLQALIALGGRGVCASQLALAVWPQQASDDPHNLMDNTVHRLRALLGGRETLIVRDAKLSLNDQQCWVDAWAFECLGNQYASAPSSTTAAAALQLYQGHFLQREDSHPWLLPYRERLHQGLTRLLLQAGQSLEDGGQWAGAAQWYSRAVQADPLCEALHYRLMQCHQQTHQLADALAAYQRCSELLREVVGVPPSQATQALARSLGRAGMVPRALRAR